MSTDFKYSSALNTLLSGQPLSHEIAYQAFHALLNGQLTPAQISGLIIAMRMRGETPTEVAAAAQVMRELVTPVKLPDQFEVIDLCGTGGDGAHTFNISTACMFVLAAAGVKVAKHGGRSVSSSSGSADVLEYLGVNINLNPDQVAQSIQQCSVGFMFAPNHHSAMRFAGPVRKELGVRTIFNALGPLTNPAAARLQLMGVYEPRLLDLQAEVLAKLGSKRALVVHGQNGMDELCVECPTSIAELMEGEIHRYEITPESVGLQRASHDSLKARSVEESADKIKRALGGEKGAIGDIVLLNSAAGFYLAGTVTDLKQGVAKARSVIESGAALAKLNEFATVTQSLSKGAA